VLILQTYSREVLAILADRIPEDLVVTVLHTRTGRSGHRRDAGRELVNFDSLTLDVGVDRGTAHGGSGDGRLVDFMRRLRSECLGTRSRPRLLDATPLEESYEVLDALETFVRLEVRGTRVTRTSPTCKRNWGPSLSDRLSRGTG